MRVTTSLSNRIFLSCTLLAALSLGFAFYFVNARASEEAEAELGRGLRDASMLVDQFPAAQTDNFTRMARLLAEVPYLKAGVGTTDAPTVQPLANDFRQQINADVIIISAPNGRVLASAGRTRISGRCRRSAEHAGDRDLRPARPRHPATGQRADFPAGRSGEGAPRPPHRRFLPRRCRERHGSRRSPAARWRSARRAHSRVDGSRSVSAPR
jgi:hypothetical protein